MSRKPLGYELKSVLEGERWDSSAMNIIDEAVRMKSFSLIWKWKDAFSDLQNGSTYCPSSLPRCVTQGYTPGSQGYFIRLILNFSGPPLSCHTCSYMNDQGKCLRGEGVCSTQNSQQCMLKKIFEGMWGLHGLVFDRELISQLEYWWGRGWLGWQGLEEESSWDSLEA